MKLMSIGILVWDQRSGDETVDEMSHGSDAQQYFTLKNSERRKAKNSANNSSDTNLKILTKRFLPGLPFKKLRLHRVQLWI